jgi:hypothetical protein
MKNKVVVESEEILSKAAESGAFNKDDAVLVDNSWIRVCRPGLNSQEMAAVIHWARDNATDNQPSEAKIVRILFLWNFILISLIVWSDSIWRT